MTCRKHNKFCDTCLAELNVENNLGASMAVPTGIKFKQGEDEVVKPFCSRLELTLQSKRIPYTLVY